jgi:response regulator RpfG family c-di-GMP phosphodiesterase
MEDNARILLVDNAEVITRYLREKLIIEGGYSVFLELNAEDALETFKQNSFNLVIVNFDMPGLDTIGFVKSLKKIDQHCVIIAFLKETNSALSRELLRLGAYDFIDQPVSMDKLFFLIKKGIELHSLTIAHYKLVQSIQEQNISLHKQNTLLAKRIEESTKHLTRLYEDLRSTYMRTIKALAKTIDARDHYTHSHSENVAKYAVVIAEEMRLPLKEVELIRDACELHDLGKIGVDDSILIKPSGLDEQEWEQIKTHPLIAAEILEPLTFLNGATELIRQHHEHYDGSGYPKGLKGEAIALGARIVHLADAYEAMRSARSYRKTPLTMEEAVAEIKQNSGTQFDPKVVDIFLKVVDRL